MKGTLSRDCGAATAKGKFAWGPVIGFLFIAAVLTTGFILEGRTPESDLPEGYHVFNPGFEVESLARWTSYGATGRIRSGMWRNDFAAHSGRSFFEISAFNETKDGGLYQRINTVVGSGYRVKVWSRIYWSGNSQDSTQSMVGVDPTGGTDPWATTVVWSSVDTQSRSQFSEWRLLSTPIVKCTSDHITIFLDAKQSNPSGQHIDAFDDVTVNE